MDTETVVSLNNNPKRIKTEKEETESAKMLSEIRDLLKKSNEDIDNIMFKIDIVNEQLCLITENLDNTTI